MKTGHRVADGPHDFRVVVAGEAGMDAALQANLGRASLPRLLAASHDLVHRHEVGGPAQVLGELSFRERAETALEVAHVRVLDVPRDDVGHHVAVHVTPQAIRSREDSLALGAARGEEAHELVLAELMAVELERERVAADEERNVDRLARGPTIFAREAVRVGRATNERAHGGIDPTIEVGDMFWVERQPRHELEAA